VEPIEAFGMAVFHDKNNTGLAIVSGVQHEIIRAEVEHSMNLTGDATF
jgi:hypothetical protein